MPIGKNAIKRVTNNGYSKVQTDAPDMENSEVVSAKIEAAEEKKIAPKKSAPKKTSAKKPAPKKSMEKEPDFSPVKTAEKKLKTTLLYALHAVYLPKMNRM